MTFDSPAAVATPIKSKNSANTSFIPSGDSQASIIKYVANTLTFLNNNFNIRQQLLDRDRSYFREKDWSLKNQQARSQNRGGNPVPIQNVTIPVVMPQVETALAGLSDIFLTGYPIFPVLSKPAMSDPALQMETLVGEHSVKYGWAAELAMTFRDGLKYNLMGVEVFWKNDKVWSVATDGESSTAASKATETYYQGNVIKRLNPYNLIIDTRVADPSQCHKKAEFLGYTELINRIELKQLFADLGPTSTMNAKEAFESGTGEYASVLGTNAFYIPQINPNAIVNPTLTTTNWLAWAGVDTTTGGIKYSNMYEKTVLYCRIIPADFNLSSVARNTVQIWKFIVINRKILIFAERQTNAHNYLGIIIGQPIEDGLGWQTKSYAENAAPMQDAATALYTSGIESQRRKVYDRMLYDPSRINKVDIDNVSPVARIPVKQIAYGQPLQEAVYVVPYRDDGVADILAMSREVAGFADTLNGQNKAQQGQFTKGNRSRKEFETIMGNSNSRIQLVMAISLEYRFMQPLKEIIKLNILQYQPPTTLYNRNTNTQVAIDPVAIRAAALEFKLSDGLLPVDKMVNIDALGTILQMTANDPQFQSEYDIPGAIMYSLQLQGAAWLADFKRTPQQQMGVLQNNQATSGVTDALGSPIQPTATVPQPAAGANPNPPRTPK